MQVTTPSGVRRTCVALSVIFCALLGAGGAPNHQRHHIPSARNVQTVAPTENAREEVSQTTVDTLTEEDFHKEFPDMVDPAANSKFLIHYEDMSFIRPFGNHSRVKRNAVLYANNLWPYGRVPYTIATTFDAYEKRIILKAMAHWEEHTCIRFHPKRSTDRHSINIHNRYDRVCSSFVGRITYYSSQGLSLGSDCVYMSTVVHELGHAIGLYHEHNRNDRDNYITVNPDRHFFPSQLEKQARSNTLGIGYDYASIMHYDVYRDSIIPKIRTPLGGAEELSPLDIAKVNRLYRCGKCDIRPPLSTTVPPLSLPKDGNCGRVIQTSRSGSFSFPGSSGHRPHQKCNFVIAAPEGYGIEYSVRLSYNLDSSSSCSNSYISFYEGATTESHRIYNFNPSPRFCKVRDFRLSFILPSNVTTISYRAGSSQPWLFQVSYSIYDKNECFRSRGCQRCSNTRGSFSCICRRGFYLSKAAKTCYDVNECAFNNGGCRHYCLNTAGSYTCSCRSGYNLQADGKSCSHRTSSASPWPVVPGFLNTNTCPVSFTVPNQPPAVTPPKPTKPPTTTTPTSPPTTTPTTTPTTDPPTVSLQEVVVTSNTMGGYNTEFSTTGWPDQPYPLNMNVVWRLQCPSGAEYIDVKFHENFKVAGKMPNCPKDQVYLYSNGVKVGGPFCHVTAPEPMMSLSAEYAKVTFTSGIGRGATRTGFSIQFQCRAGPTTAPPPTTLPPTTTATTTVEPTTMKPTTMEPTTMEPTTMEPTTMEPTTMEPTTMEPTTMEPTTMEPTTMEPTTMEPTTMEPTTTPPTTTPTTTPTTDPPTEGLQETVITSNTMGGYNSEFSTPGWPDQPYPLDMNVAWRLQCPSGAEYIDVKFHENFKVAGKMPNCPKDQVYLYSNGVKVGGPFCHVTAPEPMMSLSAEDTKVTFTSGIGRGVTRTGFSIQFQCRAGLTTAPPPTTLPPTTTATTAVEPTTMEPTTMEPTTMEPTTMDPTTMEPTTMEPTTMEPTTTPPTTTPTTTPTTDPPTEGLQETVITSNTMGGYNSEFSTPGWPDQPYPLDINVAWRLQCPSGTEYIDVKFHENFKVAGKMPNCPKDQVYLYSNGVKVGGPFCHITAPEPMMSLSAEDTKVTFTSGIGRGVTRTGFSIQFQCRAGPTTAPPPTTLPPTAIATTTVEPTTMEPTTMEPTTMEPTTMKPTTVEPTTMEPTMEPTTMEPTTMEPTTMEPTTMEPTTMEPTIMEPTTMEPTTVEPRTMKMTTIDATTVETTTTKMTTPEPTTPSTTLLPPVGDTVGPCGPVTIRLSNRNEYSSILSTPGWPTQPYPYNIICEWRPQCPSNNDLIDISFEESFRLAGAMPSCLKSQVKVYSNGTKVGGPFCHTTAPKPLESLAAKGTRITFYSGSVRSSTKIGFAFRFQCRPTNTRDSSLSTSTILSTAATATSNPTSSSTRTTTTSTTSSPTSLPTTPQRTTATTTTVLSTKPQITTVTNPTTSSTQPKVTAAPTTLMLTSPLAISTRPLPTTAITSSTTSSARSCGGVVTVSRNNQFSSITSTPGWPAQPYPKEMQCEWVLRCPPNSRIIRVRFDDNFRVAGKMPDCVKDRVMVETSGNFRHGPFCHTTSPEPIDHLDARNTKVIFYSGTGRGITRYGFAFQFLCLQ